MKNKFDRKEEAYEFLPRADQIAPSKVFGTGEGTAQMLIRHTGMSNKAALNNLSRLKAEGRAHIHTWTKTQCPSAVWVKGPGEDKPKPAPDPQAALFRHRAKMQLERARRKDGAGTVMDSRARTASTIEQARAKPQNWFSSLGSVDDRDGEQAA